MPPAYVWPSDLVAPTAFQLCWRCGQRIARTTQRRTCIDCRWVVRHDPVYNQETP